MQLEKDVRLLTAGLAALWPDSAAGTTRFVAAAASGSGSDSGSGSGVRSAFSRLSQIALLLNLDRCALPPVRLAIESVDTRYAIFGPSALLSAFPIILSISPPSPLTNLRIFRVFNSVLHCDSPCGHCCSPSDIAHYWGSDGNSGSGLRQLSVKEIRLILGVCSKTNRAKYCAPKTFP